MDADAEPIADAAEVARALGVSRQQVGQLAAGAPGFPAPVEQLDDGPRWSRSEVEAWAARNPDRGPRYRPPAVGAPGGSTPRLAEIDGRALDEARALHNSWLGVEHLALALLQPSCPGWARTVLESVGLTYDDARERLADAFGDPFDVAPTSVGVSPATQLVLERAKLWAIELRDEEVASEHVLLALLDNESEWLIGHAVDRSALRRKTIAVSAARKEDPPAPPLRPPWDYPPRRIPRPPELELAASPLGHDPRRRRPWGSAWLDVPGRRQYLIDRDGYPVLTTDGKPIHLLIDENGQEILDENGGMILTALEVPEGLELRRYTDC